VKKTSIYLDPGLDRALGRRASLEGITKAELIRRVLGRAVLDSARPRISAIGVGEGPGGVASEVDRHLTDSGFGDH
jgi:hypothetical protein